MKYNPAKHHRQSIRLKGYDYSSAGAYFITLVLQHRLGLFGSVNENGMQLSHIGTIARQCWEEIPFHFPRTTLNEFIIMPHHMHGIIFILPDDENRYKSGGGGSVQLNAATRRISISAAATKDAPRRKDNYFSIISPQKKSLSVIIRTYKGAVTTVCRKNGFHQFEWQRNYHDRIVRNDRELSATRKYIINNPAKWLHDKKINQKSGL